MRYVCVRVSVWPLHIGNARKAAHVALLQKRKATALSAQKGEGGEGAAGAAGRAGTQGDKTKKRSLRDTGFQSYDLCSKRGYLCCS